MSKDPTDDQIADDKTGKGSLPRFHLLELFPDAQSIFSLSLPAIESVRDTALVVLDTNALVIPYTIQKKSLDEIRSAYERLIEQKRLFVPAQVAREFGRIRAVKIQELFQKTSLKQSVSSLKVEQYPLLDSIEGYTELLRLEKEINEKIGEYRKTIKPILEAIRSWNWNDPVSAIYRTLFSAGLILEPSATEAEIEADFQRRIENRVPPGYKDSGKDDGGIGDIVIWNTILELGKEKELPLIFVTGEEKPDWMLRSENEVLSPRFELVDEYARVTNGQPFYIVKFHELLDFVGVVEEVVEEVKKEEAESTPRRYLSAQDASRDRVQAFQNFGFVAERLVLYWLKRTFPDCSIDENRGFPDFAIQLSRSRRIGVDVKAFRTSSSFQARRLLSEAGYRAYYEQNNGNYERIVIVLAYSDKVDALEFLTRFARGSVGVPEVHVVVGYIENESEFIPLLDEFSGTV